MKVSIVCEKCNSFVELVPINDGQQAHLSTIESHFRINEIDLDYDYNVEEIEEVTAEIEEIRFDCKKCGDYIVLNDFPSSVYR